MYDMFWTVQSYGCSEEMDGVFLLNQLWNMKCGSLILGEQNKHCITHGLITEELFSAEDTREKSE